MAGTFDSPLVARDRVMAVDALRGFDMFWIVGGQELALAIARIFADPLPPAVARQFEHVEWEGFVAWDLIMPQIRHHHHLLARCLHLLRPSLVRQATCVRNKRSGPE